MSDRLVILASSLRPDVYFNIIGHNARQGTTEFILAAVGNMAGETPEKQSTELQRWLTRFVEALMNSSYLQFSTDSTSPLKQPEAIASFFEDVVWGRLQFTFRAVQESELTDFLKEQRAAGASFDVTACKNSVLAGAVAWLVSRGGSPIHTFEVLSRQTFDERDLLPNLSPSRFRYLDLSRSGLIRRATRFINAGTISKKRFWAVSLGIAAIVGLVTFWAPADFSGPILAFAATLATIMSAVSIIVRGGTDD